MRELLKQLQDELLGLDERLSGFDKVCCSARPAARSAFKTAETFRPAQFERRCVATVLLPQEVRQRKVGLELDSIV
jgi:hypothetical protein